MIVPDVNILVHAYNADSPLHHRARAWWEGMMNGTRAVGLPWIAVLGFIRITTHRGILHMPIPASTACDHARTWLAQPQVDLLRPGEKHAELFFRLIEAVGTAGNLTTDAHLAALAIENQAELNSTDTDFSRFPGLKWKNPLA